MNGINNLQNSVKSVKSKGVVIFATNTDETDYVAIAEQNARLVEHFLGLPTTIVSAKDSGKNTRYNPDLGKYVEWKNFGRHEVYEASPYDETILLDADYLVFDDSLLKLFCTDFDYLLFNKNWYINIPQLPSVMGERSLPHVWATAVLFRKTEKSKMFFDLVAKIKRNYHYYRMLYNVHETNYRNDYAFAIAHYILNGYTINAQYAPGHISTFSGPIQSIEYTDKNLIVKSDKAYVLPHQNIHVMSKSWLTSPALKQLVDQCLDTQHNKVL